MNLHHRDNRHTYRDNRGTYRDNRGIYRDNRGTYRDNRGTYRDNRGTYRDNRRIYRDNRISNPLLHEIKEGFCDSTLIYFALISVPCQYTFPELHNYDVTQNFRIIFKAF